MTFPLPDTWPAVSEPAFDDYRTDPAWLLARAVYFYPDADTPDGRLIIRFDAVREMHRIESLYERPSPAPR